MWMAGAHVYTVAPKPDFTGFGNIHLEKCEIGTVLISHFWIFGGVEGNGYGGLCEMGKDYWRRVVPNEVVFHISGRHEWRPYENRIPCTLIPIGKGGLHKHPVPISKNKAFRSSMTIGKLHKTLFISSQTYKSAPARRRCRCRWARWPWPRTARRGRDTAPPRRPPGCRGSCSPAGARG